MPKTEDNDYNYSYNNIPICPNCDTELGIDDDYELYEDGLHERICPVCDKSYEVKTDISYEFSTDYLETKDDLCISSSY